MARKISEYFKVTPKKSKIDNNLKVRDCFAVLNDTNGEFHEKKLLNSHIKKKHLGEKIQQFECDFDGKIFKTRGLLYNHMKVHLPLINCEICNKILKARSIKTHLRDFHSSKEMSCKICSKTFKSVLYLNSHEKTHNKKIECKICKKMFPSIGSMNKHKRLCHDNARSFQCETCKRGFNRKSHLKNHQKTHDKNRLKPYKCQRCDYATDSKQQINKHQNFHESQDQKIAEMKNPLKCEKCPKFFRNKNFLKQHISNVHPIALFQCDLCAKFVKIKYDLVKHLKLHILKVTKI